MSNTLHVVSLSGGKDSTYLLLEMLKRGMRVDRILNVDTTKEFPAMYRHLEKLQQYIGPEHQIETAVIDFDYWFATHIKTKGKHKGKCGYGWPDFRNRWCTALKREAISHMIGGGGVRPSQTWTVPPPSRNACYRIPRHCSR